MRTPRPGNDDDGDGGGGGGDDDDDDDEAITIRNMYNCCSNDANTSYLPWQQSFSNSPSYVVPSGWVNTPLHTSV